MALSSESVSPVKFGGGIGGGGKFKNGGGGKKGGIMKGGGIGGVVIGSDLVLPCAPLCT